MAAGKRLAGKGTGTRITPPPAPNPFDSELNFHFGDLNLGDIQASNADMIYRVDPLTDTGETDSDRPIYSANEEDAVPAFAPAPDPEPRPAAAKPKRRFRFPFFFLFCVLLTAGGVFAIVTLCSRINDRLAEMDDSEPVYVIEEAFQDYFDPPDWDRVVAEGIYSPGLADAETVKNYLISEVGDSEITLGEAEESGTDLIYPVRAGDKRLATLVLSQTGKTTENGYPLYELSRLELPVYAENLPGGLLTIRAPADYTVTVDGQVLDASKITETYTREGVLPWVPEEYSNTGEYSTYTVSGLTAQPQEITVTTPDGQQTVVKDEGNSTYSAEIISSADLQEQYSAFVIEAVERFSLYMQDSGNISLASLRKYFDTDSELFEAIAGLDSDRHFAFTASRWEYEELVCDEFYRVADNAITCHISFICDLFQGATEYPDPVDLYILLRDNGSGYKLAAWYNNLAHPLNKR